LVHQGDFRGGKRGEVGIAKCNHAVLRPANATGQFLQGDIPSLDHLVPDLREALWAGTMLKLYELCARNGMTKEPVGHEIGVEQNFVELDGAKIRVSRAALGNMNYQLSEL